MAGRPSAVGNTSNPSGYSCNPQSSFTTPQPYTGSSSNCNPIDRCVNDANFMNLTQRSFNTRPLFPFSGLHSNSNPADRLFNYIDFMNNMAQPRGNIGSKLNFRYAFPSV